MGNTYTRQSSFTDGDVITADLFNNEYDQLLAAFAASTGHTHDGTAAEGGPITKLLGTSITIGDATSGTDITVTFDGESNDGVFKWMEDEDYFEYSDDILIASTEKLQFRDTAIYINSSADGQLDLVADTEIQIAATTIDINGAADISGNLAVGGNLTVTGTTTFNGGTLTLGDSSADNVVFGADVDSSIIPDDDDTYDLGSADQQWRNIFIDGTAEIDTLAINGTTVTSTAAELNILDGVTSTAAELNILDGVTSTAAEINILDGVTSTAAEINVLDGITSTVAELNILDGVTASATDINLIDGITNGTVIASKAIITDSNKDISGGRNITISGELDAATLDISGDADIDGTLEADAITIGGITLAETISDTVGAMVSSNTETNITVTYDDSDNTLDFVIGTLNQDTTGLAATATALATARTIHGVSFDGTANIDLTEVVQDTVGAMVSSNTESGITVAYQDGDGTLDFTVGTLNQDTTGTAALATQVTVSANDSTNESVYLTFVDGATGSQGIETDSALSYNPSTNTLTVANISVSGTQTIVDSVTMNANNAVIFEGSTADAHETTLTTIDATGDRTISLPNVSGTLPVLAAVSTTQITSTPEELNILDGVTSTTAELNLVDGSTAGSVVNSKAVVYGSSGQVAATSATVAGDLTVDTNTLAVVASSNRVGVNQASPDVSLDLGANTDAVHVPVGTTGQRPTGAAGYFRYNTSLSQFEGYTDAWGAIGGGGTNTFTHDVFTANGSTTAFALSQTTESENNLIVFVDGVFQEQGAYSIATSSGTTTLTMSAAPANGRKLVVYSVAAGVSGSNLNIDTMTGDGSDTTLTLSIAPVNENNTQVFFDGVYQNKSTYSISGTTLTFSTAPPTGVAVEVMTFTQTDINVPVDGTITSAKLSGNLVTPGTLTSGNTTISSNTISNAAASMILDSAGDIILDADGQDVIFKDGGTQFGSIRKNGNNIQLMASIENGDITFHGDDGGSDITALTLDMSDAGAATFNSSVSAPGGFLNGANGGIRIHTGGTKFFNVTAANAARDNIMDIGASDAKFKDLYLGGNVKVDAGQGILFGGTAGASGMTSQVLDDYEEGTFTPVYQDYSGNTITNHTAQVGRYTKVGRFVHIYGALRTQGSSDASGLSGNLRIGGLPFTAVSLAANGMVSFYTAESSFAYNAPSELPRSSPVASNTSAINVYKYAGTGGRTLLFEVSDLNMSGNSNYMFFGGTYEVA